MPALAATSEIGIPGKRSATAAAREATLSVQISTKTVTKHSQNIRKTVESRTVRRGVRDVTVDLHAIGLQIKSVSHGLVRNQMSNMLPGTRT